MNSYRFTFEIDNSISCGWLIFTKSKYIRYRLGLGYIFISVPTSYKLYSQRKLNKFLEIYCKNISSTTSITKQPGIIDENSVHSGYIYILGEQKTFSFRTDKNAGDVDFSFVNWLDLERKLKSILKPVVGRLIEKGLKKLNITTNIKIKFSKASSFLGALQHKVGDVDNYVMKINLFVAHFSENIIEALVFHELCHLLYSNHGKGFYNTLYKICPDYDSLSEALKLGYYKGVQE